MHSIEVLELDKRYWIPENLAECTREQYLDMAKLIYMFRQGDVGLRDFRVFGLYALLGLVPDTDGFDFAEEEKWQNIFIVSEVLDSFFTQDDAGVLHLVQGYIHNPVKSVRYLGQLFHGPRDAFQDFKYGQLEDAVGEMQSFRNFGDIEHLVRLFAVFHLRSGEKYESVNLEKRAAFFKHLDIRYVYGFYLLWVSFFIYLTSQCMICIDGRELDLRILFKAPEGSDAPAEDYTGLGMRSTSFQLAESGVFGTLEELRRADGMMVTVRLYDLMKRAEKEEADRKEAEAKAKSNIHD